MTPVPETLEIQRDVFQELTDLGNKVENYTQTGHPERPDDGSVGIRWLKWNPFGIFSVYDFCTLLVIKHGKGQFDRGVGVFSGFDTSSSPTTSCWGKKCTRESLMTMDELEISCETVLVILKELV